MHRKTLVFAAAILVFCSMDAFAFGPRTFVSGTGLDTNTCGRTDPCRSFTAAQAQTADGGEIVALDTTGYGAVSITKSLAIIAPLGVHAAITAFAGDGVAVSVNPTAYVALRNLYINAGGATNGITFNSGAGLHIEHCVISGFSKGINLIPTNDATVIITDTMLRQDALAAIFAGGSSTVEVTVDHCHMERGGFGVLVDHGKAAVSNSTADGNSGSGFAARGNDGPVTMIVESCTASHNNVGVLSQVSMGVLVHNSAALNNDVGYYALPGDIQIDHSVAGGNTIGIDVNAENASIADCTIANNTSFGVRVENFSHAFLLRNTITKNDVGVDCTGGTAHSTGDNAVENNNATDVNCTFGPVNKT